MLRQNRRRLRKSTTVYSASRDFEKVHKKTSIKFRSAGNCIVTEISKARRPSAGPTMHTNPQNMSNSWKKRKIPDIDVLVLSTETRSPRVPTHSLVTMESRNTKLKRKGSQAAVGFSKHYKRWPKSRRE